MTLSAGKGDLQYGIFLTTLYHAKSLLVCVDCCDDSRINLGKTWAVKDRGINLFL